MKTFLLLSFNAITTILLSANIDKFDLSYPAKQSANNQTFSQSCDYIYSQRGNLISVSKNNTYQDNFYVQTADDELVRLDLDGSTKVSVSSEIGYLARILSAESLVYTKKGNCYNVSMFTRVCIAESIKNRKNSNFGFFANYKTYRGVILYTGYATYAKEFSRTYQWLQNSVAKMRFVEEVLPVAIFIYFNDTNFTDNATGFITPAKLSSDKYQKFQNRNLITIDNIDAFYEFTFWKY